MANLSISEHLAYQLTKQAEKEGRSLDDLLDTMLRQYLNIPDHETLLARLRTMKGITVPDSNNNVPPPLSDEEAKALADRIGAKGSMSDLIIEERKQGY